MTSLYPYLTSNEQTLSTPSNTILSSNYPNPFNPSTTISYELYESGKTVMEIYNLKGQKVITLINKYLEKGKHSIIWNGKDKHGKNVASGVYLYKITSNKNTLIKKMLLIK